VFPVNERSLLASRSHRIRSVRSGIFGTNNNDVFLTCSSFVVMTNLGVAFTSDSPILKSVLEALKQVLALNGDLRVDIADIRTRLGELESLLSNQSGNRHAKRAVGRIGASGPSWSCPVCGKSDFSHADSFKGHMRKLLPENMSARPKCHWKSTDPDHVLLVQRFEGVTFENRCVSFSVAFYNFLKSAISSSFTAHESFKLVSSWLYAAVDSSVSFPVLSSSSSGSQRRVVIGSGAGVSGSD